MIKKQKTLNGTVWDFESGLFRISLFGFRILLGLTVIAFVLVVLGEVVQAQQSKKVPRIGYLTSSNPDTDSARSEAIRQALRERGYLERQNIAIEYRYADGKVDRFSELAAELVRLKVDIILVAGGDRLIGAAKDATKTIPIVMTGTGLDPVEAGLVESLARPGGNITGVTNLTTELSGKRLELLKEIVPNLVRVAVLYETNPANEFELKSALPATARALGLTLQPGEIRGANDLAKVFAALTKRRPDGLYALGGPLIRISERRIADFASKDRLPLMNFYKDSVDSGGLVYYGADLADGYRRVAYYVDKILKGAKPADLPVEQPKKFELIINLKTAKQIGLTVPPNVLARADRVIR